jgi:hypothetical protein
MSGINCVFRICDGVPGDKPGELTKGTARDYPYTIGHHGRFYVGCSDDGGRGGNSTAPDR